MDLWTDHMRRGDFTAAWAVSDRALLARTGVPCWHLPRHEQHIWNGDPVEGRRVLVRCYHGLGDTVQFVRYAAPLRERAREVIVWAQPELLPLLASAAGVDRLLPLHDGTPDVAYDLDVEIMELPHLFRSTPGTLPARVPYLHAAPAVLDVPAAPGGLRVGIVWEAGGWDGRRSVPVADLAPLAAVPGVTLCALQRGPALAAWPRAFGPVVGSDNILMAASAMGALDLIVSVDSFPAHLAGALGRPVWTLLHAAPDWRWMDTRADSPWYPTMRLFRQERAGNWAAVIARVAEALRVWAGVS